MSDALIPMETPPVDPEQPNRYIVKGVRDRVGLHPATIYAEIKAGRFPKPVKFGRSSRWPESEIDAWIEARKRERGTESDQHQDAA